MTPSLIDLPREKCTYDLDKTPSPAQISSKLPRAPNAVSRGKEGVTNSKRLIFPLRDAEGNYDVRVERGKVGLSRKRFLDGQGRPGGKGRGHE